MVELKGFKWAVKASMNEGQTASWRSDRTRKGNPPGRSPLAKASKTYRAYVITFLLLLPIYALVKTLFDLHILFSTGRIVGTEDWLNAAFLKREKIVADTNPNEPRILIVAGSNGLFGLSAKTIQQETGIQTINLSAHAGLGGDYLLNRASRLLRKGDWLLLPLEYQFYRQSGISSDFERQDTLRRFLISYDRSSLQSISPLSLLGFWTDNLFDWHSKEYGLYVSGNLTRQDITKRLQQQKDDPNLNCFSGLTFNSYGDETCNEGKENFPLIPVVLQPAMTPTRQKIDPAGYLNRFIQTASQKGVRIIPLYPVSTNVAAYQEASFQAYAQRIRQFWVSKGIEFNDSLERSLLPPNLMYNTNYHPKDSGRQVRTKAVLDLLRKQLNREKRDRNAV